MVAYCSVDFPHVQELTGDWYLGSVYMSERKDKIRLRLCAHFLGHYPRGCAKEEIDDYLGMDAWFDYDPVQDAFIVCIMGLKPSP